jgi:methionyl-tRNA formyltransferase
VAELLARSGRSVVGSPAQADLALAPRLHRKLSAEESNAPQLGTLIFHPSLLPLRRGPDAVRWTVAGGDRVTGVTWFWCSEGLDAGDICEQELVAVPRGYSPGRLYHEVLIPAGLRSLERALDAIDLGFTRRVPQDEAAATVDPRVSAGNPHGSPATSWAGQGSGA